MINKYDLAIVDYVTREFIGSNESWEDEYPSEVEWYRAQTIDDVEDSLINEMIEYGQKKYNFGKEIEYEDYMYLDNNLREYYELG